MYKLLIVDDEKQIREGLKKILEWEDYGISICGEAADGKEAFELIRVHHPEIVITDIQMPNMDGLQLLTTIREVGEACRVIVLSGYDDYALVRQAMKDGAIDYLLKPSSKTELIPIIDEIIEDIEKTYPSNDFENLILQRTTLINRFFNKEISSIEMSRRMSLMGCEIVQRKPCCVGYLECVDTVKNEKAEEDILWKMCRAYNSSFLAEKQVLAFISEERKLSFLFHDVEEPFGYNEDELPHIILKTLESELKMPLLMIMGSVAKSFRSMAQSYVDAKAILDYRFAFPEKKVLHYELVRKSMVENGNVAIEIDISELHDTILSLDINKMYAYVDNVFAETSANGNRNDVASMLNAAIEITVYTCQTTRTFPYVAKQKALEIEETALRKLHEVKQKDTLLQILKGCLNELVDLILISQQQKYSKLVFDMIQHIMNDYSNPDMSLQYLADELNGNRAYMGRIFKKETGWSFNDYLSNFRIEKAKELLLTSNYKGTELSEKIGFSNYNYFYFVFKKKTGVNPMDYRK